MKDMRKQTEEAACVSIIVPVYNTEDVLLEKCMDSIRGQSYRELEILLIDDGSTDAGTIACMERLHNRSLEPGRRLILIRQDNQGVMAARKTGIDAATGKYLAFVDSDDCIHREYVQRLKEMIESGDYDLAEASGEEVEDIFSLDLEGLPEEHMRLEVDGRERIMDYLADRPGQPLGWSLWGKLYQSAFMKRCYQMHEGIYYGEDVVSLAEYAALCQKALISDCPLYYYNKGNAQSATAQKSIRELTKCRFGRELVRIYRADGTPYGYRHAKAIYIRMLLGSMLECEYRQYNGYRRMQRQFRRELWRYRADVLLNPYISQKYKYIIAFLSTKPYVMKQRIKARMK